MMNRLKQNEPQWKGNQQQINNQISKSPQKQKYENYHNPSYQGQNDHHSMNNIMMNSNLAKNKPLISPKKTVNQNKIAQNQQGNRLSQQLGVQPKFKNNNFMTQRTQKMVNCMNHPQKKAEFIAGMDENEELQYYCGRCAAQLATRGIQVQKIQTNQNKGILLSKRQNDLPHYPQYVNEPIYQQILQILSMSNQVVREHNQNMQKFSSLQKHYEQQITLTGTFYDRLIEIIEEMKTDHLEDLMEERDKNTQIADIQNDNLRENIIQVNDIKNDIENHLQEVVQGIRETGDTVECKESLEHYRQKLTLCKHLTQEQIDTLKEVTHYSQNKFDHMIQNFQSFLKIMWESPQENQQHPIANNEVSQQQRNRSNVVKNLNSAMTVKNIHQILPKGVNYQNCEGKKAFRNLQDDEEEQIVDRKSPIFKQI